jgi:hypothetical protein
MALAVVVAGNAPGTALVVVGAAVVAGYVVEVLPGRYGAKPPGEIGAVPLVGKIAPGGDVEAPLAVATPEVFNGAAEAPLAVYGPEV